MGLHAGLPSGNSRHVHVHTYTSPGRRLAGGTGQPGTAQVLDTHHQALVQELEAGLDEPLLLVRVSHLDAGPLVAVVVRRETGRGQHADTADAVPAGAGTQHDGQVAHPGGPSEHQALGGKHAQAEHVDQWVSLVGLIEDHLAAHGGHPDSIAVTRHPGDHALGDPPAPGVVKRSKAERIHEGDGSGAHGEDVAQDAPHPGSRPLVGLDGRGVVVRLDADGRRDAVAHVDHSGVLTGSHQHPGGFGGKPLEVNAAALVGAVLRPHDRVHGQFQAVGRPGEDPVYPLRLLVGQPEGPVEWLAHDGHRSRHQSGTRPFLAAPIYTPWDCPESRIITLRSRWFGHVLSRKRTGLSS